MTCLIATSQVMLVSAPLTTECCSLRLGQVALHLIVAREQQTVLRQSSMPSTISIGLGAAERYALTSSRNEFMYCLLSPVKSVSTGFGRLDTTVWFSYLSIYICPHELWAADERRQDRRSGLGRECHLARHHSVRCPSPHHPCPHHRELHQDVQSQFAIEGSACR